MIQNEQTEKLFRLPYNDVYFHGSTLYQCFERDEALIAQYTSYFTPEWKADYQAKLLAAKELMSDEQFEYYIVKQTKIIDERREILTRKLSELYMYVKLAHDNKVDIEVYKPGKLYKAKPNVYKLLEQADLAFVTASQPDELARLTAVGYSQAKLSEIQMVSMEMRMASDERDKASTARRKATTARIETLNALWKKMQELSTGAKLALRDNPAKWHHYNLYPKGYKPRKRKAKTVEIEDAGREGLSPNPSPQ